MNATLNAGTNRPSSIQPSFSAALLGAALLLLAGCAAAPVSEVTGARYHLAEMNRSQAIIIAIDGSSSLQKTIKVEPGQRNIELQALPTGGFRQGEKRVMKLDVKPCTRYYLNVQRPNSLSQDWDPVVDFQEPIAGCKA